MAPRPKVGRLLIDAGVLLDHDVHAVLDAQSRDGGRFCSVALRLGLADERALVRILSRQLGVPGMVVGEARPDAGARDVVDRATAARASVLPIRVFNRTLTVLMSDPADAALLAELQARTGKVLRPLVALAGPLHRAIAEQQADAPAITLEPRPVSPDIPVAPLPPESTLPPFAIAADPTPVVAEGPLVLAVDDDAAILRIYEGIFDPSRWRLVTCGDGDAALARVHTERPDVVLLDARLPGLHGFEICRRIKHSDALRRTIVVILSGAYRGWQMRADLLQQCGADDFVEKPFDVDRLRERVEALLSSRRDAARTTRSLVADALRELNAGLMLLQRGDLDGAAEALARSAQADPNAARPRFYLGKIHERRGRTFDAMYEYERAVSLDASFFPAIKDLAILYQANGFVQKAIEMWQQALAVCPEASMRNVIKDHLVRLL